MSKYDKFIGIKNTQKDPTGFDCEASEMAPFLYDWQKEIVSWSIGKGRSALFEDCGCGKTAQSLCWCDQMMERSKTTKALIIAPLAVSAQTKREAEKFGMSATVCKTSDDLKPGINITNYERLHHFDSGAFASVVADESSIIKHHAGKMRQYITEFVLNIPYALFCTATPAPNDFMELGCHSEAVGMMRRVEMLSTFFAHDSGDTQKWRLKGHAQEPFWKWLSSWSVALRKPEDIGFNDDRFNLPALHMEQHTVKSKPQDGQLFASHAVTLNEQRTARRHSQHDRVEICADKVNASTEPYLVWCDLNSESAELSKAIPDSVEVKGADKSEHKEQAIMDFIDGKVRVLVSKPSIAGHGMNFQHCNQMAFVGLSHSFEAMYQAIRRCWRYGQTKEVTAHIITSEAEGAVLANIKRKEKQSEEMYDALVKHMSIYTTAKNKSDSSYIATDEMEIPAWLK